MLQMNSSNSKPDPTDADDLRSSENASTTANKRKRSEMKSPPSSSSSSSSATSSMEDYLLPACKQYKAQEELEEHQQRLICEGNNGTVTFGRVSEDVFREACNELLVLGKLPLSFIDSLAWKHFCKRTNLYEPHSTSTATRDIVQLYKTKKAEMMSILGNGKQRVSITIDIWVAPSTATRYMMVTAHYIDAMWCLRKIVIGFKNVLDYKESTIVSVLLECLAEWGIEKVFTITVDNATANTSTLKIFKEAFKKVGNNALVLGGEYLHIKCAAHVINSVVKDALHEVDANVAAIRNGVTYVRSSTSRVKSFDLRVDSGKMTTRGSLALDCETRWNSTYLMLTRALKFRMAFDKMEAEDKLYSEYFEEKVDGKKRVGPPSKDDWEAIERLVRFLRIFYISTLVLSASNSVSSSNCYAEICTIERNLILISQKSDGELHSKAKSMREKFDKYWDGLMEINRMLIVASVFDPRYKMRFATFCFEKIYGKDSAECRELHDSVSKVLKSLFEEYSSVFSKSGTVGTQSQSTDASSQSEHVSGDRMDLDYDNGWYKTMDSVYKEMVDDLRLEDESNELELYLKEKVENPNSNFDVLHWWRLNESKYPILAEIARDVLAMQVSSVASESAFSTSGRILDPYRSCLTHYMIEVLMCTEQWLKCSIDLTENGAVITNKQLLADIELQDSFEKEFQSC